MSAQVRIATAADRPVVLETLVAAFAGDPVLRWLFPDDAKYPGAAEGFFGALFDRRVGTRSIWTVDGLAVAMWDPPVTGPAGTGEGDGGPSPTYDLGPAERARVEAYDAAVHAALPPQPYWYLGVLGTHPDHAGRRWGRAVMAAGLRRAAEEGLPAVLETSAPRNVALYERSGWEVVREIAEPVPTWIMRQAAPGE